MRDVFKAEESPNLCAKFRRMQGDSKQLSSTWVSFNLFPTLTSEYPLQTLASQGKVYDKFPESELEESTKSVKVCVP